MTLFQDKHFYNTTDEDEKTAEKMNKKGAKQEDQILAVFKADPFRKLGASDLEEIFPQWHVTSIRRALNNLYKPVAYMHKCECCNNNVYTYGRSEILKVSSEKGAAGVKEFKYVLNQEEEALANERN